MAEESARAATTVTGGLISPLLITATSAKGIAALGLNLPSGESNADLIQGADAKVSYGSL
jgi:hypothetical protein